jgi:hypothetical protein
MPHSLASSASSATENTNDDVIEFNTADGIHLPHDEESDSSPMRRRLLTLPVAGEFQVNTYTPYNQQVPAIAMQPNGNFVIVWNGQGPESPSDINVYGRIFDVSGSPLTPQFRVDVNTATQQLPDVAAQFNGDFIVIWDAITLDGQDIYGQRFDIFGNQINSNFLINSYTAGNQNDPRLAVQPNNNFIVTWTSYLPNGDSYGIYAQRFNAIGLPLGSEFRVNSNTITTNVKHSPSIGVQTNGDFVIAWSSFLQDGDNFGVYAQRFNATGSLLGLEFPVNTYTDNFQGKPIIRVQFNNHFIIAWRSNGQDGDSWGVYAQRFNATGSPLGSEFRVNSNTTNAQLSPSIGVQSNGDFVITWQSYLQDGNGYGIYAQRFNESGFPLGLEFQVNTYTLQNQELPVVGVQPTGDFVITWDSIEQDGDSGGVYARIFRPLSMGNNTLTLNQNQAVTLTTNMLSATSGGTASDIRFMVNPVKNGRFELSNDPGVAIFDFTKQQIIDGVVKFVPNGSANAPSFSITVTDGNETLGPFSASINFTPAPMVSSTGVSSSSSSTGGTAAISSSSSTGVDAISSSSSTGGAVAVSSSSSTGVNVVSSSSSTGGAVAISSSSSTGVDAISSSSSTGGVVAVSSSSSTGTDVISSSSSTGEAATVSSSSSTGVGTISSSSSTGGAAAISSSSSTGVGAISSSSSTGGAAAVSSSSTGVSTSAASSSTATASINHPPVIMKNEFTIDQDGEILLTENELKVLDQETPSDELMLTVATQHCVALNPSGNVVTTFPQKEIADRTLRLRHTGGSLAPALNVSASDGVLTTGPSSALVHFRPTAPVSTGSGGLSTGAIAGIASAAALVVCGGLYRYRDKIKKSVSETLASYGLFKCCRKTSKPPSFTSLGSVQLATPSSSTASSAGAPGSPAHATSFGGNNLMGQPMTDVPFVIPPSYVGAPASPSAAAAAPRI